MPCCDYEGRWGNLGSDTIASARKSEAAEVDRASFARGEGHKVSGCRRCFEAEARGERSLRKIWNNELYPTQLIESDTGTAEPPEFAPVPSHLDIRFSNLCNFKCRTCWFGASSSWYADAKAMGYGVGQKAEVESFGTVEQLIEALGPNLVPLKQVYMAGGEPFMIRQNYELLEHLIAIGKTDIRVSVSTNGSKTALGAKSILALLAEFDAVHVVFSIDVARQDAASIVRHGFSFDQFKANVAETRAQVPGVNIAFGVTVSALSVSDLADTLESLRTECHAMPDKIHVHSVVVPQCYQPCVLPAGAKREASRKLAKFVENMNDDWGDKAGRQQLAIEVESIRKALKQNAPSSHFYELVALTKRLDGIRGERAMQDLLGRFFRGGRVPEAPFLNKPRKAVLRVIRGIKRGLRAAFSS